MNLDDISKKLVKNNFKEYGLLFFSFAFAVCMTTTMGIIQFSPTVTDVLISRGSAQLTANLLYFLMIIGSIVFIIFSQDLFMKYKAKEIGIFLALGISKSIVRKIVKKEIYLIILIATIVGLIIALPISYLCWNFIGLFFSTNETNYAVGFDGFIVGIIFAFIAKLIVTNITIKYIKKADILKIINNSHETEKIKTGNSIFGIIGLILVIIGPTLIYFSLHTSHPIWGNSDKVGLLFLITGLYLIISQISTIGNVARKLNRNRYYKNIIFYDLMKLKGKQYTLSLFVATILISVGFFGLIYNIGPMIEGNKSVQNARNDFEYTKFVGDYDKDITQKDVLKLANKNDVTITKFDELDGILLTSYRHLSDFGDKWWWSKDVAFVSETEFNSFFNESIDVSRGKYYVVVDNNLKQSAWNELVRPRFKMKFFNPANKEEFVIKPEKTYEIYNKMSQSLFQGYIRVLDDKDYSKINNQVIDEFKFKHRVFNVQNLYTSLPFSNKFNEIYLKKMNYFYNENMGKELIQNNKLPSENKVEEITPEMKRWWIFKPFSKIDSQNNLTNDWAVYLVVFLVIAITSMVFGSLVIGVKIINGAWNDKKIYKDILYLGAKTKNIKSIINKQIASLYLIPSMLSIIIILALYQIIMKGGFLYYNHIMKICYFVALIFILLQFILYKIISIKVYKHCIKTLKD